MKPGYESSYDDSFDEYIFPAVRNGFHGRAYDDYDEEEDILEYDEFEEDDYLTDDDYYS
ncbi:MAG: hypothetical protein J5981_07760 [Lachnospira sp.]|nr:hypothetical protein [Lachnospira sp.]